MKTDITRVVLAVALIGAGVLIAAAAQAEESRPMGQHPAVLLQADVSALKRGVDPQTFIVGHPARLALSGRHANGEHPALAMQRQARHPQIDVNTYLVQPPSPTVWTVAPAAAKLVAIRQN